jgi:hypothetical protein
MRVFLLVAGIIVGVIATLILLRRRSRAVVEGCVITVRHDSHCTAIVEYRERRRKLRFAAEVGVGGYLWVDVTESMYTDDGEVVLANEYKLVKQRLTQGLTQLGIAHELVAPESQTR